MAERLIQALRRGGCAARQAGSWGVWRHHDLRGRCIGVLAEPVIASLELLGDVGPLATRPDLRVWTGTKAPVARPAGAVVDLRRRMSHSNGNTRSSLESALDALPEPSARALCQAAVLALRADLERAACGQRSPQGTDLTTPVATGAALAAADRLARVQAGVDRASQARLHRLVIQEYSLRRLADLGGVTQAAMKALLVDDLMRLARVYRYLA